MELFVDHGTWHCPTLIRSHTQQFPDAPEHSADPRLRFMAPDEVSRASLRRFAKLPARTREAHRAHWPAQLRLTKMLADAGVPLLAGSDANGAGWVIPGYALHDEFDLLAEAGLAPLTILQAATLTPARFLGRERSAGRVAVGHRADLVVLDLDATLDRLAAHPSAR